MNKDRFSKIFAVFGLVYDKINYLFSRFMRFFIEERTLTGYVACMSTVKYLFDNYEVSKINDYMYTTSEGYIKPLQREGSYAIKRLDFESSILFFKGWTPIWIRIRGGCEEEIQRLSLHYPKGMIDFEEIFQESVHLMDTKAVQKMEDKRKTLRRFGIFYSDSPGNRGTGMSFQTTRNLENDHNLNIPLRYSPDEITGTAYDDHDPNQLLNNLYFPPEFEKWIREFGVWVTKEEFYTSRGLNWRRGWLFTGEPGTGKTSFIRALAYKFNIPIYVARLGTLDNNSFEKFYELASVNSPSVFLMEEIDGVFENRKNISEHSGLTFDTILETLGGVKQKSGVFTVISSNRPNLIDKALAYRDEQGNIYTRPGRIDRVIEFQAMTKENKRKLAEKMLAGLDYDFEELYNEKPTASPAEFQEICRAKAEELTVDFYTID